MDKREFTGFYRKYVKRVYKFVYFRVGSDRRLAEDLTQDVFLKAFQAFERYDPAISQASWIYTIARNHLINHYAKSRPGVSLDEVENLGLAAHDGREAMIQKHLQTRLFESLEKLPPEDARLVRMKYLEGWAFDELAEILGKTSGALRVQAIRALRKLKGQTDLHDIL